MSITRGRKRKAWVIILSSANPAAHPEVYARIDETQPLAVLPPRTAIDKILVTVEALLQVVLVHDADDRVRFLAPVDHRQPHTAYGRAERHAWGQQVIGGTNPWIEAFHVDDLQVITDTETGRSHMTYTRRPVIGSPLRTD